MIFIPVPPQKSLGLLLHERFDDIGDNAEREGIQGSEVPHWVRWLVFVVGVLIPAIKMAVMEGIPRTKTLGMLFLASYVVIEFMVVWASVNHEQFQVGQYSGRISWDGYERIQQSRHARKFQHAVDLALATYALGLHCDCLVWAYCDIWISMPAYSFTLEGYYDFIRFVMLGFLVLVPFWYFRPFGFINVAPALGPRMLAWMKSLLPFLTFGVIGASIFVSKFVHRGPFDGIGRRAILDIGILIAPLEMDSWIIDLLGHLLPAGVLLSLVLHLSWAYSALFLLSIRYPAFGKWLLLVTDNEFDRYACFCLLFFAANLIITVFWYWAKYNPVGTVIPTWAGVFGQRNMIGEPHRSLVQSPSST
jgi:hypothetical protein